MSRLANVLNPEYFKRNRWVCDSRFYETYSWFTNLGDRVKCKQSLWTDRYKEDCHGNDSGVDQVEEMTMIGYTTGPSGGLENHGKSTASVSLTTQTQNKV